MTNTAQSDVQAVLDTYAAAVYRKDVDAFAGLYAHDAHVFDAWAEFEATGAAAQRAMATGWFESVGGSQVLVDLEDVVIVVDGQVAWAHAAVTFGTEGPDGERQREQTNRFTFGLRIVDGAWKIAHQHSSLPVDFTTDMAIRER